MRLRRSRPDPRLRDHVQSYLELEFPDQARPEQNPDLPERTVRLMFFGATFFQGRRPDSLRAMPRVMLSPFSLQAQLMFVQGPVCALVAELYPWGARQLFGWRAADPPGPLDEALSAAPWCREVVALLELGEWAAAGAALEARLLALAAALEAPGRGVQAAQQIYQSLGTVRVATLAETLGLSPRSLERQFAEQVGVGAKTLARVVRFEEVHTRLRRDPGASVSDLTFELGFFDQAHLIREFKALSSMTPGAFAAVAARRTDGAGLPDTDGDQTVFIEPPGWWAEDVQGGASRPLPRADASNR